MDNITVSYLDENFNLLPFYHFDELQKIVDNKTNSKPKVDKLYLHLYDKRTGKLILITKSNFQYFIKNKENFSFGFISTNYVADSCSEKFDKMIEMMEKCEKYLKSIESYNKSKSRYNSVDNPRSTPSNNQKKPLQSKDVVGNLLNEFNQQPIKSSEAKPQNQGNHSDLNDRSSGFRNCNQTTKPHSNANFPNRAINKEKGPTTPLLSYNNNNNINMVLVNTQKKELYKSSVPDTFNRNLINNEQNTNLNNLNTHSRPQMRSSSQRPRPRPTVNAYEFENFDLRRHIEINELDSRGTKSIKLSIKIKNTGEIPIPYQTNIVFQQTGKAYNKYIFCLGSSIEVGKEKEITINNFVAKRVGDNNRISYLFFLENEAGSKLPCRQEGFLEINFTSNNNKNQ